jgi:hypothetical protein
MEVRSSRIVATRNRKTVDPVSLINVDPAALGRVLFRDLGKPTFSLGIFDRQTSKLNRKHPGDGARIHVDCPAHSNSRKAWLAVREKPE